MRRYHCHRQTDYSGARGFNGGGKKCAQNWIVASLKNFRHLNLFMAVPNLANGIATKYSCTTLTINGGIQMRLLFLVLSLVFAGNALAQEKPNMLIIWGDDIGFWNLSTNNMGMMGYETPNIDRIANEGAKFTDYYGQQSCTAGRSAFILGQSPIRTGLTKVGSPGADLGIRPEDVTLASLLKDEGYVTAHFGKNHLGDKDEFLPTNHGFDEFFGNLYHLNA